MILLQVNNPIQHLISSDKLFVAIVIFLFTLLGIMAMIFAQLYNKKRNYFLKQNVQKSLELWISKSILEEFEEGESRGITIPSKFTKRLNNRGIRQYALESLLASKKELTGTVAENIIALYVQLGLREDSLKKFKSVTWYVKAKGIEELYVMNQHDMLPRIYKYTNNKNDLVRMEAQTAVIHFSGFEGLRFLDVTSLPISNWQQLKLIEQLRRIDVSPLQRLQGWLSSTNDYVVIFALKLVEVFQQYQAHDWCAQCLEHENEKVRGQAIISISSIANDATIGLLTTIYDRETYNNRLRILTELSTLGSISETGFLKGIIEHEDAIEIKLYAAKALAKSTQGGILILEQQAEANKELLPVYKHVKSALVK